MISQLVSVMPLWCRCGACCAGILWMEILERIRSDSAGKTREKQPLDPVTTKLIDADPIDVCDRRGARKLDESAYISVSKEDCIAVAIYHI